MNRLIAFFFVVLLFSPLGAEERQNGNIVIVIDEELGRFSLYRVIDDVGTRLPLFVDQDPRTSFLSVLVGNRIHRMGDEFDFRQAPISEGDAFGFTWTSRQIEVRQTFRFGKAGTDTVLMGITVKNLSESKLDIGARFLLDTSLGEDNDHFSIPDGSISREIEYADTLPDYIRSASPDGRVAMQVKGAFPVGRSADRIIIANWKRLNDTPWILSVNEKRNFNLLPYSVNDSAVCLYFDEVEVGPTETMSVGIALTAEGEFQVTAEQDPEPVAEPEAEPEALPEPEPEQEPEPEPVVVQKEPSYDFMAAVDRVDVLLANIESWLTSGSLVPDRQLEALERKIKELEAELDAEANAEANSEDTE